MNSFIRTLHGSKVLKEKMCFSKFSLKHFWGIHRKHYQKKGPKCAPYYYWSVALTSLAELSTVWLRHQHFLFLQKYIWTFTNLFLVKLNALYFNSSWGPDWKDFSCNSNMILFALRHCYDSSYVSSRRLSRRIQNHIGCIYLTFLHCAFSNGSSNRLPGRMHSHTGCTCLTFPHCVFSNVSSNRLPEKRRIHTDCICLTFLHCVFSNVPSKHLRKAICSHTGCIFLTFLCCAFWYALSIVCTCLISLPFLYFS